MWQSQDNYIWQKFQDLEKMETNIGKIKEISEEKADDFDERLSEVG